MRRIGPVLEAFMDFKSPGVPMLNEPTLGTAAGDAFYARVVRRVGAWHDSPTILDKILAEMQERPEFYEEMMRQESAAIAQPAAVERSERKAAKVQWLFTN